MAITAQQLACGYIETKTVNSITVTLWSEHGVFHVRAHDFNNHERIAWETLTNLTDAKKEFRKMCKNFQA